MKRQFKFYLASAMMLMVCAACSAQKMFSEAAKYKGVESVYISKALCRMGVDSFDIGDVKSGIKELDGLEVLSCEKSKDLPKVKAICDKIVSESGAELLLSTEEDDETVYIYGDTNADENTIGSLFIVSSEPDEYNVVYIKGKFNLEEIINSSQKK